MPLDVNRRKELLRLVPEGSLVKRSWLREHFSINAIDNLVKSRQLETVIGGVYKREGTEIRWPAIIYFLQHQKASDLTIGGLTALELQKLGHYIPLNDQMTIHLYGSGNLPKWAGNLVPDVSFQKHSITDLLGYQPDDFTREQLSKFTKAINWNGTQEGLAMSTPERAILEVLNEVPEKIGFEHAYELMQGLTSLSPRALQQLLELCHNFKLRRLFFWFAERLNYTWLSRIDRSKIELGSGNRVIAKGGKLNKKYLITVPESYE